jgi:hypothetical protein
MRLAEPLPIEERLIRDEQGPSNFKIFLII